jgi:DNA-directed RNA polymerase specialized sigma24 family protein
VIDLSFAEIATMVEIPETTAMSHARRARVALREALRGGLPSAASRPSLTGENR